MVFSFIQSHELFPISHGHKQACQKHPGSGLRVQEQLFHVAGHPERKLKEGLCTLRSNTCCQAAPPPKGWAVHPTPNASVPGVYFRRGSRLPNDAAF